MRPMGRREAPILRVTGEIKKERHAMTEVPDHRERRAELNGGAYHSISCHQDQIEDGMILSVDG